MTRLAAALGAGFAALADLDAGLEPEKVAERRFAAVRLIGGVLFDLEPVALPRTGHLVDAGGLFCAFASDPGQTEALTTTVRGRLRGQLGRRAVVRNGTERAARLLDRQVERPRPTLTPARRDPRAAAGASSTAVFDGGAARHADPVRRGAVLPVQRSFAATGAVAHERRHAAVGGRDG